MVFQPIGHYLNQLLAQGVSLSLLNHGGGAVVTGAALGAVSYSYY